MNVIIYLLIINVLAFIVFGIDKYKAKKEKWRIKETTLFLLSFIGGGFGSFLGMNLFHHKVNKASFRFFVPLSILITIIVIWFLNHQYNLFEGVLS